MVALSFGNDRAIHLFVLAVLALSVRGIWVPEHSILGGPFARAMTAYMVAGKRIHEL